MITQTLLYNILVYVSLNLAKILIVTKKNIFSLENNYCSLKRDDRHAKLFYGKLVHSLWLKLLNVSWDFEAG